MAWTLYTSDGFEALGTFVTGSSMQRWIDRHPGLYVVDHGDGRMRSVGAKVTTAEREREYERLFAGSLHDASRAGTSAPYRMERERRPWAVSAPSSRSDGRRGTGHTHPPGRTRCPKCGV